MSTTQLRFSEAATPTWSGLRDIRSVLWRRQHLRRTAIIAVTVGTVFFAMNQLNILLAGHGSPMVWFKVALTYATPFVVSSIAVLSATHRPASSKG